MLVINEEYLTFIYRNCVRQKNTNVDNILSYFITTRGSSFECFSRRGPAA